MVFRLILGRLIIRFGRARLLAASMSVAAAAILALCWQMTSRSPSVSWRSAGSPLAWVSRLPLSAVAAQAERRTQPTARSARLMGNQVGQRRRPGTAGLVAGVAGVAGSIALTGIAAAASTGVVISPAGSAS